MSTPTPRLRLLSLQPNYWWDAERQECAPCRCSLRGSIPPRCDDEGRCVCRQGFVGRRCDLRRRGYERRETQRPVERVPIEAVQQRWGGPSRSGGCPRGAYRPAAGVTSIACGWQWCVSANTHSRLQASVQMCLHLLWWFADKCMPAAASLHKLAYLEHVWKILNVLIQVLVLLVVLAWTNYLVSVVLELKRLLMTVALWWSWQYLCVCLCFLDLATYWMRVWFFFFPKWFSLFFLPLKLWSLPAFWLLKKIFIFFIFLITTTAYQTFLQCLSWVMLKTNCVPSSIWCCSDFLAWNCDSMFTPLSHFCFLLTMMLFFAV